MFQKETRFPPGCTLAVLLEDHFRFPSIKLIVLLKISTLLHPSAFAVFTYICTTSCHHLLFIHLFSLKLPLSICLHFNLLLLFNIFLFLTIYLHAFSMQLNTSQHLFMNPRVPNIFLHLSWLMLSSLVAPAIKWHELLLAL